jgi:glycosyltransferase involved in cell wall biosynthesis
MTRGRLLFLAWGSPWPAESGGALRALGLLTELNRAFEVELLLLTRHPLSLQQREVLGVLTSAITAVPLKDVSFGDRFGAAWEILRHRYPYHSAVLAVSLYAHPDVLRRIGQFPGVVFASVGHWGALVFGRPKPNWILNQCDADVEFWRVYASQTTCSLARLAARINYQLARSHFPGIYANVGRIISVCEEDRQLTLALAPQAQVDVIENGVDCSYFVPHRIARSGPPRLLFTGTSAARNMTALHSLVKDVLPLVRSQVPDVELLVGGNFSFRAQAEFAGIPSIDFTGRVDDMRPVFDQSDVFVAPFQETHGSKLKIAEAMAMAIPIVSTSQGVRGFPLVAGESVLVADDVQEFAAYAAALLRNPERRLAMGQAARQLALSTIDWHVLGKRLVHIIETTQEQVMQG